MGSPQIIGGSKIGVKADSPVLSILIPSYNRGVRVRALCRYLKDVVESQSGKIEVVVSNNVSTDKTELLLQDIASNYIKVVNRTFHLSTAEEHIFDSLKLCRGRYVWFLGDDDIPYLDTVRFAVDYCLQNSPKFLCFRSRFVNRDGGAAGGRFIRMNSEILSVPISEGAAAIGIISGFAGISNAIMEVRHLSEVDSRSILIKTPIYSHVAWWLIAFKGEQITFVNRPLVAYRVDDPDAQASHFKKHAKKSNVSDFYYWAEGLISLLSYLESEGAISAEEISQIYEVRKDGSYFRLLNNIVYMLLKQTILSIQSKELRNKIDCERLNILCDWVLHIDPEMYDLMTMITDLNVENPVPKNNRVLEIESDFRSVLSQKESSFNYYCGLFSGYRDYSIYRHISGWVAFPDERGVDRFSVLRGLDVDNRGDDVIYSESIDKIHAMIDMTRDDRSQVLLAPLNFEVKRVADAIYTHANAVFEAGRFPHVSLARSIVWRIQRRWRRWTAFAVETRKKLREPA